MCNLNNNDYKILSSIVDKDKNRGLTMGRGSTIKHIIERTGFSDVKIRNTIKALLKKGYIMEAVKKEKAKTYCITKEGVQKLQELQTTII